MRRHRKTIPLGLLAGLLLLPLWAQGQSLDAALRYSLDHGLPSEALWVRVQADSAWSWPGFHRLAALPGWRHGRASVATLRGWIGRSGVRRMEHSNLLRPLLDKSLPAIGVSEVHAGALGQAYTGSGVLVGIVDSGIDWRHPDFIRDDGTTRIACIWDQTDESGTPPEGFGYGSFYDRDAIQAALDGTGPEVGGMDSWGHGTHVAGIAAGNGRATGNGQPSGRYVGVAPGTELVIVKSGDRQFVEDWILDGIQFCFQYGESLSPAKPVSVNLSVGETHWGPHDGTSTLESGIDALLWTAGRCLVVAAGNDGARSIHFQGEATVVRGDTVAFDIQSNVAGQGDYLGWDIWADHWSSQLRVSIVTPAGDTLGPVLRGTIANWNHAEGTIYVDHASTGLNSANNAYHTWIRLGDGQSQDNLAVGRWQLLFSGQTASFHGWLYDASVPASIAQGASSAYLLPEPANSHFSIAVGSYITRLEWPSLQSGFFTGEVGALSSFSSLGPTRDGRQKPDLAAPGEYIVSSRSQMGEWPTDPYVASDSLHRAWSGTSMAAPHVTGAAALLFEMDPTLSSSQIKSYLINSADKDGWTGSAAWDPGWGRGKLNVLEALRKAPVSDEEGQGPQTFWLMAAYPNPFNPETRLVYTLDRNGPVKIVIYDLAGRRVRTLLNQAQSAGQHACPWDGRDESGRPVASGVYLARLTDGRRQSTQKLMLLR